MQTNRKQQQEKEEEEEEEKKKRMPQWLFDLSQALRQIFF